MSDRAPVTVTSVCRANDLPWAELVPGIELPDSITRLHHETLDAAGVIRPSAVLP